MIVYYLSAPVAPPVKRANIIVSSSVGMVFLIGGLILADAYSQETVMRAIAIAPIYLAGTWAGRNLFKIAPAAWFKNVAYMILLATGIMALAL
jgi:uncharacterized membrane protein YpjA